MAHHEQQAFIWEIKELLPEYFNGVSVIDIGSQDINGNNQMYFNMYDYTGVDICEGDNVDVVCQFKDFNSTSVYDTIISTECFEHDEHYKETILNAIKHLKSNGLFIFTCAAPGRPEHGTTRTSPKDSPATTNYYKNLSEQDIRNVIDCEKIFRYYEFRTRKIFPQDLYFYGIKK